MEKRSHAETQRPRRAEIKEIDEITGIVIDESIRIHRDLGPVLLESVYEAILFKSLLDRGPFAERQKPLPFEYNGIKFEEGFRLDLLVENRVILGLKSVEKLIPVHGKQLLTYLRLSHLQVGLLINFGAATLKEGVQRVVNHHSESPSSPLRIHRKQNS
jgi:iron complex transport system substrate-binding protein